MVMEFYKVDVFTDKPFKGNPAAVVLGMPEEEIMQSLAFELNISETVFVEKRRDAINLRFFTPYTEIDLCGHATIGAFYVLKLKGLKDGNYRAITKAGEIEVKVEDLIWLRVVEPKIVKFKLNGLEDAVGVKIFDSAVVDVGIPVGLAEVENFEILMKLKPDSRLAEFCKDCGIVGVHFYTFDSKFDACTRFFAPAVGIPEDPVTGTANSALAYYLNSSGKLVKECYEFEQGHALRREGIAHVKLDNGVWVGGKAVCIAEGKIEVY